MKFLTSLRGIAALLVVLYHIKHWLHAYPITEHFGFLYNKGYLAVDFFFILSGFIIAFNYRNHFLETFTPQKYRMFIYKRFARIFPLHFFVLLCFLSIPLAYFLSGRTVNQDLYTVDSFLIKATLSDMWLIGSGYWNTWNVPSWTISGEFFSYLLFPLLAIIAGSSLGKNLLVFSLCCVLIAFSYELIGARSLGDNIAELGLLRCSVSFFIGICVFNLYTLNILANPIFNQIVFYLSLITLGCLLWYVPQNHYYFPGLMALILLSLIQFHGVIHHILGWRPLVILGDISYSVYLTHSLILIWFNILLLENNEVPSLGKISIFIVMVLTLSAFSYHFIEVPARQWLNKKSRKE